MKHISKSIDCIGVLNPNLRVFDVIMKTEYGTSYNSYLVKGSEKTAIIEAVHLDFFSYFMDNLEKALRGGKIDYLVLNHCEPDHTGCITLLLEKYPDLTVVVSGAGSVYIKNIVNNDNLVIKVVKDGDEIDLGGKTLKFISAPFLHWPDSMFTYLPEDKTLFTCDFLGSHYCEPQVFDRRIAYPEQYATALKYYYDCIFGPFPAYVRSGLDKIKNLDLDFVACSHGPVLTKDGHLEEVIEKYTQWSAVKEKAEMSIPIFYCTAYNNTRSIAKALAKGISEILPTAKVRTYNIIYHDMAKLTELLNESDAFLIGSTTINRDAAPPIWQLLSGMEAINIAKRPALVFGSFGWSGEAIPHIEQRLSSVKVAVYEKKFKVNFVPTAKDLEDAVQLGREFASSL